MRPLSLGYVVARFQDGLLDIPLNANFDRPKFPPRCHKMMTRTIRIL